jgi:hypothetical protein
MVQRAPLTPPHRSHEPRAVVRPVNARLFRCPRQTRQQDGIGIDCPNEDHDPAICCHVDRMRWRPAQSADKMRCGLGGFIKSVYNTPPRGGSDGNGPDQPLLRKLTPGEPLARAARHDRRHGDGSHDNLSHGRGPASGPRNNPEIQPRPFLRNDEVVSKRGTRYQ